MQATELMKRMADMVEQTGQPTLAERALPGGLALKVEALPEALRRDLSELEGERPGGKWSRSTACSVRFIPTGEAITFTPPRLAVALPASVVGRHSGQKPSPMMCSNDHGQESGNVFFQARSLPRLRSEHFRIREQRIYRSHVA